MLHSYSIVHSIDAGVHVHAMCWWQQHQHYRLRRRRRSSHKNSTDFSFFAYFSFSTSTWRYSNDFLTASDFIWLYLSIFIAVADHARYSRNWKTCWTSAWETFKLTFCRLFKNGCLGYRFRHNNNKTYKNRPVYLGRIFSQQLFVNCWKKTQFWRAL